jgi:hypothetical protein
MSGPRAIFIDHEGKHCATEGLRSTYGRVFLHLGKQRSQNRYKEKPKN